jgi:hypothetical protein
VLDLYDLPTLGLEPFDITIFAGIFYHLPDPFLARRFDPVDGEPERGLLYDLRNPNA